MDYWPGPRQEKISSYVGINLTESLSIVPNPPEEIVSQFVDSGLLERHHSTPLGIHRAQDVVYRPILARRIHSLQADQQGTPSVGVERLLQPA